MSQLCVAIDTTDQHKAVETAIELDCGGKELPFMVKFNLDFFLNCGISGALSHLASLEDRPIFADLKAWNGKRTLRDIAKKLAGKVAYVNFYALADTYLGDVVKELEGSGTKVLAVTVLTHYDDSYCQRFFGSSLYDTVKRFTEVAAENNCHGIVVPPTCLDAVEEYNLEKVCPGIRPTWFSDNRHEQEVTPAQAIAAGADILVCGSPILKSPNPIQAIKTILDEMEVV